MLFRGAGTICNVSYIPEGGSGKIVEGQLWRGRNIEKEKREKVKITGPLNPKRQCRPPIITHPPPPSLYYTCLPSSTLLIPLFSPLHSPSLSFLLHHFSCLDILHCLILFAQTLGAKPRGIRAQTPYCQSILDIITSWRTSSSFLFFGPCAPQPCRVYHDGRPSRDCVLPSGSIVIDFERASKQRLRRS